jgi:hypothetical protein
MRLLTRAVPPTVASRQGTPNEVVHPPAPRSALAIVAPAWKNDGCFSVKGNGARAARGALGTSECLSERLGLDPVDGDALALHLDHRQPAAVTALQLRIVGDVHLLDLETELLPERNELSAGAFAEVTVAPNVQGRLRDTSPGSW